LLGSAHGVTGSQSLQKLSCCELKLQGKKIQEGELGILGVAVVALIIGFVGVVACQTTAGPSMVKKRSSTVTI
jgi:hypothetical protein